MLLQQKSLREVSFFASDVLNPCTSPMFHWPFLCVCEELHRSTEPEAGSSNHKMALSHGSPTSLCLKRQQQFSLHTWVLWLHISTSFFSLTIWAFRYMPSLCFYLCGLLILILGHCTPPSFLPHPSGVLSQSNILIHSSYFQRTQSPFAVWQDISGWVFFSTGWTVLTPVFHARDWLTECPHSNDRTFFSQRNVAHKKKFALKFRLKPLYWLHTAQSSTSFDAWSNFLAVQENFQSDVASVWCDWSFRYLMETNHAGRNHCSSCASRDRTTNSKSLTDYDCATIRGHIYWWRVACQHGPSVLGSCPATGGEHGNRRFTPVNSKSIHKRRGNVKHWGLFSLVHWWRLFCPVVCNISITCLSFVIHIRAVFYGL